jgi:hypothetical protein
MDIVVTIPKSEYINDDKETEFLQNNTDAYQFWTLSKQPKKLNIGDRVYFVKNNKIECSMEFYMDEFGAENICEVTGRKWRGYTLYLHDLRYESLPFTVKGFQGFRYKWWED